MQSRETSSCPRGKRAAIARRYPAFSLRAMCLRISMPSAVRPTILRQMDMGSLTRGQIWVWAVHTKGDHAQTSLHKNWLGGTEQLFLTLSRQGIEPTSDLSSESLITEPSPVQRIDMFRMADSQTHDHQTNNINADYWLDKQIIGIRYLSLGHITREN